MQGSARRKKVRKNVWFIIKLVGIQVPQVHTNNMISEENFVMIY